MVDNEDVVVPKYKMIFLGDQGVGKSCILNRYVNEKFEEEYQATIGLDFQSKTITINDTEVRILLYDTAGQEKFRSLIPMYIRQSNIVMFVYDITRVESFDSMNKWFSDVIDLKANDAIYFMIGNKIDLVENRRVSTEQAQKFADEKGIIFKEVSAKTGQGFDDLFEEAFVDAINSRFRPSDLPIVENQGVKIQYEPEADSSPKTDEKNGNTDNKVGKKKKKCC